MIVKIVYNKKYDLKARKYASKLVKWERLPDNYVGYGSSRRPYLFYDSETYYTNEEYDKEGGLVLIVDYDIYKSRPNWNPLNGFKRSAIEEGYKQVILHTYIDNL